MTALLGLSLAFIVITLVIAVALGLYLRRRLAVDRNGQNDNAFFGAFTFHRDAGFRIGGNDCSGGFGGVERQE